MESLSESDVQRYTTVRRHGAGSLTRVTLLAAVNWAVRERTTEGWWLLKEKGLCGVRLPHEENPRRPVMGHDECGKLLEVADRFTRCYDWH